MGCLILLVLLTYFAFCEIVELILILGFASLALIAAWLDSKRPNSSENDQEASCSK